MIEAFTIRHETTRTTAAIAGLPPAREWCPRPFIIPVFIPMSGCPHRCAFCNQTAITGKPPSPLSPAIVAASVQPFLPSLPQQKRPVQIAFYGGNFLGLPERTVRCLLAAAADFVKRHNGAGIRFSTRPDTISSKSLAVVGDYPVTTIELGLQSLDDRVLTLARRGHDAACTIAAARRVKAAGYELGLQMMTGLPGDTSGGALHTAREMVPLAPDFVRIYPTLVLEHSPLAGRFRAGTFAPASLEETITLVSHLFLVFSAAGIPVVRMGLQADEALLTPGRVLAGPFHPCLGELVYSRIFHALAAEALARHLDRPLAVAIRVHPRHLSRMIGAGRGNLRRLQARFNGGAIAVFGDPAVGPHHLEVDNTSSLVASS